MARIFITGSSDGLGKMAAKLLLDSGNKVILHARNGQRAEEALKANPSAESVVVGDLSSLSQTIYVAGKVNKLGPLDAVIHNAAVGYREHTKITTEDGLSHVFAINSLAPYVLTALIRKPKRLVYVSSGLHREASSSLEDLQWEKRPWSGYQAYADSKLHNVLLAFAVAHNWKDVFSNALEPGWVPTKMGGAGAPDSLEKAPLTQVWLAASGDRPALISGGYFYHMQPQLTHKDAHSAELQDRFLERCSKISGIKLPYTASTVNVI